MAKMPRLVVPGYPYHVTQRGNRRMKTFFCDDDYPNEKYRTHTHKSLIRNTLDYRL